MSSGTNAPASLRRAQAHAAQIDRELREFRGVAAERRVVVEPDARVAGEREHRAAERLRRRAAVERIVDGLIAEQLAIRIVPIVGR